MQQSNHVFLLGLFFLTGAAPLPSHSAAPSVTSVAVSDNRTVIPVGASRLIKTLAEASRRAQDGDTVEVDAGDYLGDVAVWTQNHVQLRAVGGKARLIANGAAAERKGIWVVRGEGIRVEGFEFSGATVPEHNGAGIRLEKGSLTVRDCSFMNNENGILTSNNPDIVLTVENSEFAFNGYGDGRSHHLYAGTIAHLTVSGSYFHHAKVGHLLKSRAALNHILYNRLSDETGGRASYELEFANGGVAYVMGNIIQQDSQTENPHLISYGAEGYTWPRNELYLSHNTLVDKRPQGGVLLRVKPGPVRVKAVNNLLVGTGKLETAGPGEYHNNLNVAWDAFELAVREDYRLKRGSPLQGRTVQAGMANRQPLTPEREYAHPHHSVPLRAPAHQPGALQSIK